MNNRRRIKKWLSEQAAETQVSPSCSPSAPSVSAPLSSLHSSDESGSVCSTNVPNERPVEQLGFDPTTMAHHQPLSFHAQAVPQTVLRVGPSAKWYKGRQAPPLHRMRSYSMGDLGTRFQYSPTQPLYQYVAGNQPPIQMSAGRFVASAYGSGTLITSPTRSRSGSQSHFQLPWNSATATTMQTTNSPYEVSYIYQPQQNWQASSALNTGQYQQPVVPFKGAMQSNGQVVSVPVLVNPVYTHVLPPANVMPYKQKSRPKPRSQSRFRNRPGTTSSMTKHAQRHNATVYRPKPTFLKRIINGLTVPLTTLNKSSRPVEHVTGLKSILKRPGGMPSNTPVHHTQRVYTSSASRPARAVNVNRRTPSRSLSSHR